MSFTEIIVPVLIFIGGSGGAIAWFKLRGEKDLGYAQTAKIFTEAANELVGPLREDNSQLRERIAAMEKQIGQLEVTIETKDHRLDELLRTSDAMQATLAEAYRQRDIATVEAQHSAAKNIVLEERVIKLEMQWAEHEKQCALAAQSVTHDRRAEDKK